MKGLSLFSFALNIVLLIVIALMIMIPKTVSYGVTLGQYNEIKEGMSYVDVCYIFKQDGVVLNDLNDDYKIVKWQGKASKDSYSLITFVDDKVDIKVQEGLM